MTDRIQDVESDGSIPVKVYTTGDGRAVVEQSQSSAVLLSADQILSVIAELRACYDYCAAWNDTETQP